MTTFKPDEDNFDKIFGDYYDGSSHIGCPLSIPKNIENGLAKDIRAMQEVDIPYSGVTVRKMAKECLDKAGIKTEYPRNLPTKGWLRRFRTRHNLEDRKPAGVDANSKRRCRYSKMQMLQAIQSVVAGELDLTTAAKHFNIPRQSLSDKVFVTHQKTGQGHFSRVPKSFEIQLNQKLQRIELNSRPPSLIVVRMVAQDMLNEDRLTSKCTIPMPSRTWFYRFVMRMKVQQRRERQWPIWLNVDDFLSTNGMDESVSNEIRPAIQMEAIPSVCQFDYSCTKCGDECPKKHDRFVHVSRLHHVQVLSCPFNCSFTSNYPDFVTQHLDLVHSMELNRLNQMKWTWEKGAFWSELIPHVRQCFPYPLPEDGNDKNDSNDSNDKNDSNDNNRMNSATVDTFRAKSEICNFVRNSNSSTFDGISVRIESNIGEKIQTNVVSGRRVRKFRSEKVKNAQKKPSKSTKMGTPKNDVEKSNPKLASPINDVPSVDAKPDVSAFLPIPEKHQNMPDNQAEKSTSPMIDVVSVDEDDKYCV